MANGRFSRGVEVIADASMSFVGNIDLSVDQVVNSTEYDLFQPLPVELDLAVMDRFAAYIPGWELPKNSSEFLTGNFGFITDYLAEAFHYQFKHVNRYEEVSKRIRLGKAVEGRDEKGVKKTVAAFLNGATAGFGRTAGETKTVCRMLPGEFTVSFNYDCEADPPLPPWDDTPAKKPPKRKAKP
jgi:ATP-dependent Lon protease